MSQDNARVRPVNLWMAVKRGFVEAYLNLGTVVFTTLLSVCVSTTVFMGAIFIAKAANNTIVTVAVLLPVAYVPWVCALGIFTYAGKATMGENPVAMDMLDGIRRLFVPALKLFLASGVFLAVAIVDIFVLLNMTGGKGGVFFAALASFCVYLVVMWLMTAMYHLPLLVFEGRDGRVPRTRKVLWKSLLLAAGNPIFTLGLFLVIIAFAVVCALPMFVGWIALLLGTVAFLLSSALRELLVSHGVVEDEPEVPEEKPWKTPEGPRPSK